MSRLLQGCVAFLLCSSVWAVDSTPARPAESPVALVMYVAVGLVLVFGFLFIWWKQKKDREREQRRAARNAAKS